MRYKKFRVPIFFLLLLAMLSACQKFARSIHDTRYGDTSQVKPSGEHPYDTSSGSLSVPSSESYTEKADFAANISALQEAEDSFRALPQLRGKKINVYKSIHFYDSHRILIRIQNPDTASYVDEYHYSNKHWESPKPLVLSKLDNIQENIISLDSVPFRNAHNVYNALKQKFQEIGSRHADFTVYVVVFNNKLIWYPRTISNDRTRFSIEFTTQGYLKSFERD